MASAGLRVGSASSSTRSVLRIGGRRFPIVFRAESSSVWRLSRAIAAEPPLVLADEPTGNLDEETGEQVISLLTSIVAARGLTLVVGHPQPRRGVACRRRAGRARSDRRSRGSRGSRRSRSSRGSRGPRPYRRPRPGDPGRGKTNEHLQLSLCLMRLAGRRHATRQPSQLVLAVLGVALGVAVVVSVDLAGASARRGFELSTRAVTGRVTHQIVGGSAGVPEALYVRLRSAGFRGLAPIVDGYVALAEATASDSPRRGRRRALRLIGVDFFAEGGFRSYLASPRAGLTAPSSGSIASTGGVGASDGVDGQGGTGRPESAVARSVIPPSISRLCWFGRVPRWSPARSPLSLVLPKVNEST